MEIIAPTFQDLYEDSTRKPALSPPPARQATSTTELCLFSFHESLKVVSRGAPGPGNQAGASGGAGAVQRGC